MGSFGSVSAFLMRVAVASEGAGRSLSGCVSVWTDVQMTVPVAMHGAVVEAVGC